MIPPGWLPQYATKPSEGSKAGLNYVSAGGGKLANMGEKHTNFATNEAQGRRMMFQVAPVTKPLGSVRRIVEQGNKVVFGDDGGSYIEHRGTGQRTVLVERNGVYVLNARAPFAHFGGQGR